MIGIRFVKDVMIGSGLFLGHPTLGKYGRAMLGKYLVAFHEKLPDERGMPGGPGAGRRVEFPHITVKKPGIHKNQG